MTVNVWPSKIRSDFSGTQCQPIEKHEIEANISIDDWLRTTINNYQRLASPPISVHINGELIEPHFWVDTEFSPDDLVDIFPEPKGAEVAAFIVSYGAYILAGIALVAVLLMPRPSVPKSSSRVQGNNLDEATAKGNKAKINSVIREVAGRRKIYPDYLLPPHRYFSSETQQSVKLLLCIGKGEFEINSADVLIGDTRLESLGSGAAFSIYNPGASLAAESAAEWWHSASEVGPTSTGSTGVELSSTNSATPVVTAVSLEFAGFTIEIPIGDGSWPIDWEAGMIVRIDARYPYTVINGSGSSEDIIEGDLTQVGPFVGMDIEIAGDNAGIYSVSSFTPGSPDQMTLSGQTALVIGSVDMAISYAGLLYRIVSRTDQILTVERLTDERVVDSSWTGFDALTTSIATVTIDETDIFGDWAGPFAACPDGETTDRFEWDVFFPAGLIRVDDEGEVKNRTVTVEMQYRNVATGGAWTSVTKTYTKHTQDQLGYTELQMLGATYRPEVRVRRNGVKSSSPRVSDTVQWYGLRAKLPIKNSYDGVTIIAARIDGGGKIAAQSEQQISVVATRKLPVRSAGAWLPATATQRIAPFFAYAAKSIGYTDADIDIAELDRLDAIWQSRGDNLDMAVESASTVKGVLNSALRAGFAELTVDRGLLRPVRDELRTTFEQMYTPQNMTEALTRQFQAAGIDDHDGVDVEYVNGESWAVETILCRLPGDIGRKVEKVTLDGVTDRTRAWRIGMRQRRVGRYRRKGYRFDVELDALNSRYLSYCALADDIPGYAQSAIVLDYSAGVIASSEPLDWSAGGEHVIAIRRKDGTLSGPHTATRLDDYRVSISGLDFTPDTSWSVEPPHLLFGPLNRWNYPALITSISPSGENRVSVEAVNYDARVYADDNNAPS